MTCDTKMLIGLTRSKTEFESARKHLSLPLPYATITLSNVLHIQKMNIEHEIKLDITRIYINQYSLQPFDPTGEWFGNGTSNHCWTYDNKWQIFFIVSH